MKRILFVSAALYFCLSSSGQSVGIGTASPAPSAQLDVSSTSRGFLLPRMSKAQRNAITSPADGLLVFQSGPDSTGFYYRFGGTWIWLQNATGPGSGWSTTGNSGMVLGTNYIGTRDNNPLAFGVNNEYAGAIGIRRNLTYGRGSGFNMLTSAQDDNVAIGDSAMYETLAGSANIAIGTNALRENKNGSASIAIGRAALQNNTGISGLVAIGDSALFNNSQGATQAGEATENLAIGFKALRNNSTGSRNIAIGREALPRNISGSYNIAIGALAMRNSQTGNDNIAIGDLSMINLTEANSNIAIGNGIMANTLPPNNVSGTVAIGNGVLRSSIANNITAIGDSAMFSNVLGQVNLAVGSRALYGNFNGSNNLAIGRNALQSNRGNSRSLAIGAYAMENADNRTSGRETYNTAIGFGALSGSANAALNTGRRNTAVGDIALLWNSSGDQNTAVGASALTANTVGVSNVAVGADALKSNTVYNFNVAVGANALANSNNSGNIAIGANAGNATTSGFYNLFIGTNAGNSLLANQSNKLVINNEFDNSGRDALIYGDFALDSLMLNARTFIRNDLKLNGAGNQTGIELGFQTTKSPNAGIIGYQVLSGDALDISGAGLTDGSRLIRQYGTVLTNGNTEIDGFTRLGTSAQGAPRVKMKKITGTGPAVNGSIAINHGLNAAKILQVSVLMEFGLGAGETIPANYTTAAGYQYEWQVRTNDIFIINRNGNSANIGNRPVKILITYEE